MGSACFDAFRDGYIVGEFNEISSQKISDKGPYGLGNPGMMLALLEDGPIKFCAVPV